jgi:hypothetical protein
MKSAFCHTSSVFGKEQTFEKRAADDTKNASKPSNEFSVSYPKDKPLNPEMGGWKGRHKDLSMVGGIVIDQQGEIPDDDCLTCRDENGLFFWSQTTIDKLEASNKIGGVTSIKSKQMHFALSMLEFTYHLMMSPSARVELTPFKSYMGQAITMQKNRTKGGTDIEEEEVNIMEVEGVEV